MKTVSPEAVLHPARLIRNLPSFHAVVLRRFSGFLQLGHGRISPCDLKMQLCLKCKENRRRLNLWRREMATLAYQR
jgi:hypothetical protein